MLMPYLEQTAAFGTTFCPTRRGWGREEADERTPIGKALFRTGFFA